MTAPIAIKGRVIGASELNARFAAVRRQLPAVFDQDEIGSWLVERMKARFLREETPEGGHWEELSPESKKGKQILWQTGHLYESIGIVDKGQRLAGTATGFGFRIGIKSFKYSQATRTGSISKDTAEYGRYHQQGIGVTRRRFIGVSKQDAKLIADKVRRRLKSAVAKA